MPDDVMPPRQNPIGRLTTDVVKGTICAAVEDMLLRPVVQGEPITMAAISLTIHLPDDVWRAVKSLAPHEGDATVVILRALEEYVSATAKRRGHRSGKYQQLVKALSTPVADLQRSARPATALHVVNIRYVYELVTLEPRALRGRKNFGEKSFREVKDKLAMQGLTLGMTLEDDAYRAAVVAAMAAHIKAGKG